MKLDVGKSLIGAVVIRTGTRSLIDEMRDEMKTVPTSAGEHP